MNKKQNINYLRRFQEVVIYLTLVNIKNNFNSLDDYCNESVGNKALKLNIKNKFLNNLTKIDNVRHLKEFIAESTHLFKYHKHCHVKFASGKKFTRNSWFELKSHLLNSQNLTSLANCCLDSMSADSRKWLEKHIFNTRENNMTKTEKENLRIECEQGKHGLPYEVLVKDIEKKERRKKKSQERRLKKAMIQANDELNEEISKLKMQILEKDAELKYISQFKDITSDVPDDSPIEYEDLNRYFPDGIDEDDPEQQPLIKRISSDCWDKMNEEAIAEARELGIDIPQKYIDYANFDKKTREIVNRLQKSVNERKCSVGFAKRVCYVLTDYDVDFVEPENKWTQDDFISAEEWRENFFENLFKNKDALHISESLFEALKKQCNNNI